MPSHDTFSRLFRLLEPQAFGRVLEALLEDLGAEGPGVLAINGKTLRRSFDRGGGARAAACAHRLWRGRAAGHRATWRAGGRSRDQGGAGVSGNPVPGRGSGDGRRGLHSQSDTAQTILDRGGDDLFALKGNHPLQMRTARKTAAFCESSPSTSCERTAPSSPSPGTANARDGPATSQDPSSAKCDRPG